MESEKVIFKMFNDLVEEMKKNVDPYANQKINEENIFQAAVLNNRGIFKEFLDFLIRPQSSIVGLEHLEAFYHNFKNGASSLILSEHKSNFDVPVFFAMANRNPHSFLKEMFEKIVFVAGRKLNEEEIFVKLMAEQFNRVIVVPKTETANLSEEEQNLALKINMGTQKFIKEKKQEYIFLVYPTGTRSKPWDKKSYQGIREAFNYLKNFDQIIFMSKNGNCMLPRQAAMSNEPPRKDIITLTFSKPLNSKEFLKSLREDFKGNNENFKQYGINKVMECIYNQKGIMPWDEK